MKKLLLLSFFLSLGGFYLSAQNTVSGIVTDKKGNPIPGAKVEIKGGTEINHYRAGRYVYTGDKKLRRKR